jgi:hypothetical protein
VGSFCPVRNNPVEGNVHTLKALSLATSWWRIAFAFSSEDQALHRRQTRLSQIGIVGGRVGVVRLELLTNWNCKAPEGVLLLQPVANLVELQSHLW